MAGERNRWLATGCAIHHSRRGVDQSKVMATAPDAATEHGGILAMAYLPGTNDGEMIIGGSEDDYIFGYGGFDLLFGGFGNDNIYGGAGDDGLFGYYGNDFLAGGTGDDTILGEQGDDTLVGGSGEDELDGGDGQDVLLGGSGFDTLAGGAGADTLDGGSGTDTADYAGSSGPIWVSLLTGVGTKGDAAGDVLISIENVIGSAYADVIIGDGGENWLSGLAGNDTLVGGFGDDVLNGGAGADVLSGGQGRDWADYVSSGGPVWVFLKTGHAFFNDAQGDTLTSIEHVRGSEHADTLFGDDDPSGNSLIGLGGDDRLVGFAGNDSLDGGHGDDTLSGGDGNDTLKPGTGTNTIDGGAGQDTLSYTSFAPRAGGLEVYLTTGETHYQLGGLKETFTNIENVNGSLNDDWIEGDGGGNWLTGGSGNDSLFGGDGDDTIWGGNGDDIIYGGNGNDRLESGNGNNELHGGAGDDRLIGYLNVGGTPDLFGDAGADRFEFSDVQTALGDGSVLAHIRDFSQSEGDRIHLVELNAKSFGTASPGDDAFDWIGEAAFSGTAGELRYEHVANTWTRVYGDQDGDAVADIVIQLDGVHALTQSDFFL